MLEDNIELMDREPSRPSLSLRRKATLILMRSMLIENGLFSLDQSKEIDIQRKDSGKPFLVSPSHQIGELPFISISHSGPWIACLLSDPHAESCIDIEDLTMNRPIKKLSSYAFSKDENKFVSEMGKIGFYTLWTAKEAIAKCRGQGLSTALKIDLSSQLATLRSKGYKVVKLGEVSYSLLQDTLSSNVFFTIARTS